MFIRFCPPSAASNGPCVLVIDDDPNVHRLIERTLKDEGYRLHFASNAAGATVPLNPNKRLVSCLFRKVCCDRESYGMITKYKTFLIINP